MDMINLKNIINDVFKKKFLFLGIMLIGIASSFFYSLSIPNKYTSSAKLLISDFKNQSNNQLGSQFNSISSFVGLNSAGSDNALVALETIRSKDLLEVLLETDGIKEKIFAASGFNAATKTIIYDPEIYDISDEVWTRKASWPKQSEPSYVEVHDKLMLDFAASLDRDNGVIVISYSHFSPYFAKEFLDLAISSTNQLQKKIDQDRSQSSLDFLRSELASTSVSEIRSSAAQLIENQLKTLMLTRVEEDYLLQVLDKPYIPEKKSSPSRFLIIFLGSVISFALSIIFILGRSFFVK